MRRLHSARVLFVLLLTIVLGAPPVWGQPARPEVTSAFSQLWGLIIELWGDAGCIIDPYGGCTAGAPCSPGQAGCGIDPYGASSARSGLSFAEEGCILDPHGGCLRGQSTPVVDEGCGIDPHGGCSH